MKNTRKGEQQYRFYYGISLAFEGRVQESIRELDQCLAIKELQIAALLALIYAHRKCQVIGLSHKSSKINSRQFSSIYNSIADKEALTQLEAKLRENRKQANEFVK